MNRVQHQIAKINADLFGDVEQNVCRDLGKESEREQKMMKNNEKTEKFICKPLAL